MTIKTISHGWITRPPIPSKVCQMRYIGSDDQINCLHECVKTLKNSRISYNDVFTKQPDGTICLDLYFQSKQDYEQLNSIIFEKCGEIEVSAFCI